MKIDHCNIHNVDIVIYDKNEENQFVDDNRREVAIFTEEDGTKYIKRCIMNECDENCETIKQLLE